MQKLTNDEKARIAPFLHQTWQAIAPDAAPIVEEVPQRQRPGQIIEFVLDADRLTSFTKIAPEDARLVIDRWVAGQADTLKWLRKELNY